MAKISFTNLKLKINSAVAEVEFNDQKIEVLNYLPIEDKIDLIEITLQKAKNTSGIYNPILVEMYFNLNIVYLYTNINFTEKQRDDEFKLYNLLESSGLLDIIIAAIPEEEYSIICNFLNERIESDLEYMGKVGPVINKLIEELPKNAEEAFNILKNFNPDDYKEVQQFAQAANGGRPIS